MPEGLKISPSLTMLDSRGRDSYSLNFGFYATLAQLIEHSIRNRKVSSLSLESGSIFRNKTGVVYKQRPFYFNRR